MHVSVPALTSNDSVRQELERLLAAHFGVTRRIRRLSRRQSRYSSSCPILNLRMEFETGEHLRVIMKDLTPASLLQEARKVRPSFLYDPWREISLYQTALNPDHFGTAICYGAVARQDFGTSWLFLEHVSGPLLWQVGRFEKWRAAARWLARFHNHFAPSAKRKALPEVLMHNAEHYTRWLERAHRFASGDSAGLADLRSRLKRIARIYPRVVNCLLALPATLIHGEFYPSNIIVRPRNHNHICPIDWEVAALGPGLIDLAALVSGKWSEDERKSLIEAYRDELALSAGVAPSLPDLLESVDYCQLYLAVQWLGWAPDWSPPGEHEQDWFREAVRLSERLGL